MKYALIVGTRPNFIKAYALLHEAKKRNIKIDLIHTSQHFDYNMDQVFFDSMEMPNPDYRFPMSGLSQTEFFGYCFSYLCNIFIENKYDIIFVVGDVNSTLIAALAARQCGIPNVHVEAGLRSFDKDMPEEINRILVDNISEYLFVTEESGVQNLNNENIVKNVFLVGNTMIDTLCIMLPKINSIIPDLENYAVCTFHRVGNVDDKNKLEAILKYIEYVSKYIPVIFPMHPRTKNKLNSLNNFFENKPNIITKDPLGYLEFMAYVKNSKFVFTILRQKKALGFSLGMNFDIQNTIR
jgi:UDP-N-acetylglucosamine 2-epimerase (non-hydrolysing)